MSSLYLFALAAQNARWLDARQNAIAANVANADTPGYRAVDVRPFSSVLASSATRMSATQPDDIESSVLEPEATESDDAETTLSGNTVHIEEEMMKLGDVNRAYALSANVRRAFQQLFVASLK